ncbi:MAG TPA: FecR domain-containing protein [Steroidobacteraceae bacterium]|nr:FecR domain-containing protein [Steroidobacteraceae bacterium]
MSDIVRLKTQTQIDNEAAVWTWRVDSGALTAEERGQLEAWLRADGRHRSAFDDLNRTWTLLERLAQRPRDDGRATFAPPERRPFLSALRSTRSLRWAAAAMLILALGTTLWMTRHPGAQVLSTAVGQERHLALADGSELTLNTNTLVTVKFTASRRDIYLRRGEAHFDVVHNAARPFFVHAGDTVIRDVGTQFEVRLHSATDVDVLVDEGRVEVQGITALATPDSPRNAASAENGNWVRAVSAGERLVIAGPRLNVLPVSPREVADDLAWRQGALVFEGEPLSQAIDEVGRYTRARIVLAGPQVAALHISGRFRTDDVSGFLQALQAALPVRVSRPQPGVVYIAPR